MRPNARNRDSVPKYIIATLSLRLPGCSARSTYVRELVIPLVSWSSGTLSAGLCCAAQGRLAVVPSSSRELVGVVDDVG